jgi:hypothetical protein
LIVIRLNEVDFLSYEGPIVRGREPQYICDVCGKKKPVSQMAGKCVNCDKYVCNVCAKEVGGKVYCENCAPAERGCFIATAAFGTPLKKELNLLRNYRDNKLTSTSFGRIIVRFYYRTSPPIAETISRSQRMRSAVRYILYPLIEALKRKNYDNM